MTKFTSLWLAFLLISGTTCSSKTPPPEPSTDAAPSRPAKVVIGYYPSGKRNNFDHRKIKYEFLTHLIHAFVKPDSAGNLVVPQDFIYPELVEEAHKKEVKILLSIGGWGNCAGFPGTASTPENRQRFISQVLEFLCIHQYDGVDIDWEFVSNPTDQKNFVFLIKELSAALKAQEPPLLLTLAAPSDHHWGKWIAYEELISSLDYISCMTYDYHGPWSDHSGHNSPLYSCDGDVCGSFNDSYEYMISRGVEGEKLLLGLPFFGRSFNSAELYEKFEKSYYYAYLEVRDLLDSGWSSEFDDCALVPYVRKPDNRMIISYDDEKSIALKCQYVIEKKVGGVMIWELTQDDWGGTSVLLDVVGREFTQKTE